VSTNPRQPLRQEVTADEAVRIAIGLQQRGALDEAEQIYERILAGRPDHAAALHYGGILRHQQGNTQAGIERIERSLALEPGDADAQLNLGNLLKATGEHERAATAYRRSLELRPDNPLALTNLGTLLSELDRRPEAEAALRKALALAPDDASARYELGKLCAAALRFDEAIDAYRQVLALRPRDPRARRSLSNVYRATGERERAIELYTRWLEDEPDSAFARHMLAACNGDAPVRAPDAYVEQSFDGYATTFDAHIAHLGYRAPQLLAERLAALDTPAGSLRVLDAGCGTGLCGPLLAPYAKRLDGVDLSAGMLAVARERRLYDELIKAELTAWIAGLPPGAYDLIVSADTLVYFGALEAVAQAAAAALARPGRLLFTVERGGAAAAALGYQLQTTGRYHHDEAYVRRTLEAAGFAVTIQLVELRREAGRPVAGLLVCGEIGTYPARDAGAAAALAPGAASTALTEIAGEPNGR
jgi:predicted TPR repeat methyltransferase